MKNYLYYLLICLFVLSVSQNSLAQKINTRDKKTENIKNIYSDIEQNNLSQKFLEIKQLINSNYTANKLDSIFRLHTSLPPDYEWITIYSAWTLTLTNLTTQDVKNLLINSINIIEQTFFYPTLEGAILLASATVEAEVLKPTTLNREIKDGYSSSTILRIKRVIRGEIDLGSDSIIVLRQPSPSVDNDNTTLMFAKERYVLFLSREWQTIQEHLYKNPELRAIIKNLPSNIYQCIVPLNRLNDYSSGEYVPLKISVNSNTQKSILTEVEKLSKNFNEILEKKNMNK